VAASMAGPEELRALSGQISRWGSAPGQLAAATNGWYHRRVVGGAESRVIFVIVNIGSAVVALALMWWRRRFSITRSSLPTPISFRAASCPR